MESSGKQIMSQFFFSASDIFSTIFFVLRSKEPTLVLI